MESSFQIVDKIKHHYGRLKKIIHWIKTSPLAWFGLFILFFIILRIISEYIGDKKNPFERLYRKVKNPVLNGDDPSLDNKSKDSKGERAARAAAERIFKKKFNKVRPDILRNNVTNHNLELDIYNDDLKLGIEYSGRQHYEFVPFFHKNKAELMNQKYRDEIKRMKCKEHSIKLIEIPYTVKIEDIESFIRIESLKLVYSID